MLGTQKGIIIIIAYSGISEISQFQISLLLQSCIMGKSEKCQLTTLLDLFCLEVAENSLISLCVFIFEVQKI